MLIRLLFILLTLGVSTLVGAQPNCVDETQCRSQLIRVEIANSFLQGNAQSLVPALENLSRSPSLNSLIERSYPLPTLPFPQTLEYCQREKRTNPLFATINCEDKGLCGKDDLNPEVRELMCFKLPCPILEGTLNAGKCNDQLNIFPNQISFPTPLTIGRMRMTPTRVDFNGKKATLCFRINELSLNMSIRLGLDTRGTNLPDNGVNIDNISPSLTNPRNVCVSANIDLASTQTVTDMKITPEGDEPFISDEVIRRAARNLQISGLSGYPADQLESVKAELVPVIFQPMRDTVEESLKTSLSTMFQTELNRIAGQVSGNSSHLVSSTNLSSELGLANLQIRNQVAILECAVIKNSGRVIPHNHPCVGLTNFIDPITPENFRGPTINELMRLHSEAEGLTLTSESIKQRLLALKDQMMEEPMFADRPEDTSDFYVRIRANHKERIKSDIAKYLDPIIDSISRNQLEGQIFNFIEIQNQLQDGSSRNVGVSIPEICSDTNPSPHARREIPNCPVQAYVDLNEMNQVTEKMWDTGRLCQQGKGSYIPARDSNGQQRYEEEGRPIGSGCYMEMGGMGCYLNKAPKIVYDRRTRKYNTSVELKACFKGPVLFGIGKFGGDFKIDFSFTPKACHGGDFCMENPDVNWQVIPGSERFSLRSSSFLHDTVTSGIQKALNSAVGDAIRIPLTSGVGPLANVPLEAEGRVDAGPGYFGACLKLRETPPLTPTLGVTGQ